MLTVVWLARKQRDTLATTWSTPITPCTVVIAKTYKKCAIPNLQNFYQLQKSTKNNFLTNENLRQEKEIFFFFCTSYYGKSQE